MSTGTVTALWHTVPNKMEVASAGSSELTRARSTA